MTEGAIDRLRLRRPQFGSRAILSGILATAFVAAVVRVGPDSLGMNLRGLEAAGDILLAALTPDLSPQFLATVAGDAVITIAFAVAAMSLAVAIGIPAAVMASGVADRRPGRRRIVATAMRVVLAGLRSMHELVWALLLVAVLGLTPWTGLLAIGIPYAGAVGRVLAERLQDVPAHPIAALASAGASPLQEVLYGRVPYIAADAIGYLSYRFECAIRSAAVLSFVGLGGIGFRIEIALADLRFDQVWTLIYALVLIIVLVDTGTARIRTRMTA